MIDKNTFKNYTPSLTPVLLTELGGEVWVKPITARDVQRLAKQTEQNETNAFVQKIVLSVCDSDGNTLFSDEDKDTILNLPFGVSKKLNDAIDEVSGLGE